MVIKAIHHDGISSELSEAASFHPLRINLGFDIADEANTHVCINNSQTFVIIIYTII